jgi:tetratricopeptide (TPR) repeat protein
MSPARPPPVARTLLAALLLAAPALARPAASGPVVRAVSDLQVHDLSADLADLAAWAAALPAAAGTPPRLSPAEALASARAFLGRETTAAQRAAVAGSPRARTAGALQALAVEALAGGKPQAALAALLLAHEREPKDRRGLVNLGALLATLGLPAEALAVLDAAEAGPGPLPPILGTPGRAVALNARGFALLVQRRWADARAPLAEAMRLAPLVPEAARNLAVALQQLGEEDEAKRVLYFGVWRSRGRPEAARPGRRAPAEEGAEPGAIPATPAEVPAAALAGKLRRPLREVLDLSAGVGANLPTVPHPRTAAEVKGFDEALRRRNARTAAQLGNVALAYGALDRKLQARPETLGRWRAERILALLTGHAPDRDPALKAKHAATAAAVERQRAEVAARGELLARKTTALIRAKAATPANLTRIHDEYVQAIAPAAKRTEAAWRDEWSTEHRVLTGLAAHLGAPWHDLAALHVRKKALGAELTLFVHLAGAYAPGAHRAAGAAPFGEIADAPEEKVPSCRDRFGSRSLEVGFDKASLSLSCDQLEAEFTIADAGLLSLFAKLSKAHASGDVTVMVGASAEVMDEGAYITIGADGKVKDLGFQIAFQEVQAVAAGVKIVTPVDSMSFSFLPAAPLAAPGS